MLCSIGVFNAGLMNDAIFKFKRYEDSRLSYTGINRHEGEDIGGWDTVIKREEYERLFYNQQATMEAIQDVVPLPVPEEKVEPVAPAVPASHAEPEAKKANPVAATYGIKTSSTPAQPKSEAPTAESFD